MPLRARVRCEQLEDRSTPATFTVTNLADAGAGTLRAAVTAAEANPDADTVVFDPAARGGTVNLTTFDTGLGTTEFGPSAFYITTPVTIQGTGEVLRRDATAAPFRLFAVLDGGQLALSDVELAGGYAKGGDGFVGGGGAGGFGGAVYNAGQLTLRRVAVTGNTAEGGNGGESPFEAVAGGGGGVGQSAPDEGGDGGGPNGGTGVNGVINGGFGGGGEGNSEGNGGDGGFGGGGGGNSFGGDAGSGGFGGGGGASDDADGDALGGFGGGNGDSEVGGGGGAGMGGAVFNFGGTVTVENSTISGNSAVAGGGGSDSAHGLGGGLFTYNGTLTVTSSTLTGNAAADGGRQVFVVSQGGRGPAGATITVTNSALGQADATVTDFETASLDGGVSTAAGTGNLIRSAVGFNGTTVSIADPLLGPLANNGGLTRTHLPGTGSPVIDALDTTATALATDQRFLARVSNGRLDIGAVEMQVPPPPPVVVPPPPPVVVVPPPTVVPPLPEPPPVINPLPEPPPPPLVAPLPEPPPEPESYVVGVGFSVQLRAGDGTLLATYPVFSSAFVGGVNAAYADLTGDGVKDILAAAGAGGGSHVVAIDGATGRLLFSFYAFTPAFTGGVSVAAGDVTGDGVNDLVVGAGPGGDPHVQVFDLTSGQPVLVRSFYAFATGFAGGVNVGAGGGLLVVAAGPGGGPHVKVFRGSAGDLLASYFAYVAHFSGGASVAVGDVTGDGVPDVVVAADATGGPHVTVWDGVTGALVRSFYGYKDSFPGGVNLAVRDVTGDGVDDYLFGAGPTGGPHVVALDGRTFQLFGSLYAVDPTFLGGLTVG